MFYVCSVDIVVITSHQISDVKAGKWLGSLKLLVSFYEMSNSPYLKQFHSIKAI